MILIGKGLQRARACHCIAQPCADAVNPMKRLPELTRTQGTVVA